MENDKEIFKDEFVVSVLKNARPQHLTHDFETKVMHDIRVAYSHKRKINTALKKSMVFFIIGVLSSGTYALFSLFDQSFFTQLPIVISTLFLFFSIIIGLVCMVNYKRMFQLSATDIQGAL